MLYSITLIVKKEAGSEALSEIKKYIVEKGKILTTNELGRANLNLKRKAPESVIFKFEIELGPEAVEKIKNKIGHEKEVISYIFEKEKIKKKVKPERIKGKKPTGRGAPEMNEDPHKAKKVLASMQEEEKKIKDLDSTLDKILNE